MSQVVDVAFPVQGSYPIPVDHAYLLLSALSRIAPVIHADRAIGIHSIRGVPIGTNRLCLHPGPSVLTIRTPAARLPDILPIAGKRLYLGDVPLRLGVPHLYALRPANSLVSRMTSIKGFMEPEPFSLALERQLANLKFRTSPEIFIGRRRVLRIKDKVIVGFMVHLRALAGADSLVVQSQGLGGRRHLGCGLFVPLTRDVQADEGGAT